MMAHGELMNAQPEHRQLTMLLSTLLYQSQVASFGVNLSLIMAHEIKLAEIITLTLLCSQNSSLMNGK